MQNNFPTPSSVLVIAAHPDDMEFTCGGTVAKWADARAAARLVVVTSGDKGTKDRSLSPHRLAELREQEQSEAGQKLGIAETVFLRHRDGELQPDMALRNQLAALVRGFEPDVILTHDPWRPYQIHPDHRAVGAASLDAVIAARDHLYVPEQLVVGLEPHHTSHVFLFSSSSPDHLEDISDYMDRKLDALACHRSQLERVPDWRERVLGWAELTGERIGVRYAEAFKRVELS